MRFKSFSFLLLVLFGCAVFSYSQNSIGKDYKSAQTDDTKQEMSLQLTTSIADRKYCASDSLRMMLRLHFTNNGKQPIILYKYSSAIPRVLISRNLKAAAKKKYEYDAHNNLLINLVPKPIDEPTPNKSLFVILKTGDSYETETPLDIVVDTGRNNDSDPLKAGNHMLQVKVWTWFADPEGLEARLREKWQRFGFLWSSTVTSLPMPFATDNRPEFIECHP